MLMEARTAVLLGGGLLDHAFVLVWVLCYDG